LGLEEYEEKNSSSNNSAEKTGRKGGVLLLPCGRRVQIRGAHQKRKKERKRTIFTEVIKREGKKGGPEVVRRYSWRGRISA